MKFFRKIFLFCFSSTCHAVGLSKRRLSRMISAFPYKIHATIAARLSSTSTSTSTSVSACNSCWQQFVSAPVFAQGCVCECVSCVSLVAFIFHRAGKTKARAIQRLFSGGSEAAPRPGLACTCWADLSFQLPTICCTSSEDREGERSLSSVCVALFLSLFLYLPLFLCPQVALTSASFLFDIKM